MTVRQDSISLVARMWPKLAAAMLAGSENAWLRWLDESYSAMVEYAEKHCYARYGDDGKAPEVVDVALLRLVARLNRDRRMTITASFLKYAVRLAAGEVYAKEMRRKMRETSLSTPVGDDEVRFGDLLPAADDVLDDLYASEFWDWVDENLNEQERAVLILTLEGYSQQEIADELGISRDRARRILIDIANRYLRDRAKVKSR